MQKTGSLLIIDDNRQVLESLSFLLGLHFACVETITNPNLLPSKLRQKAFDVFLLDMNFRAGINSGNEGLFWLSEIMKIDPAAVVVPITAFGDVTLAVRAMKSGAADFLLKPWDNDELVEVMKSALRLRQSKLKMKELQQDRPGDPEETGDSDRLFLPSQSGSERMKQLWSDICKVAPTGANILILGENGTGKEVIAREIHRLSARKNKVFMNVDLGAVPESLMESELFGHVRGAFTDAREDKAGKFEAAGGGTLFLDEIGNLGLTAQAKLLSALQRREITRLGSARPVKIDIRLISATNQPLNDMIGNGDFREDLFYRLNTITLELPPLRERTEDIPALAAFFTREYARKYHKDPGEPGSSTIEKLRSYHWPGNIRELRHAIEKAVILSEGHQLCPDDFTFTFANKPSISPLQPLTLEELEKNAIAEAIRRNRGNLSDTAGELGISRPTLYRKMQKYGL